MEDAVEVYESGNLSYENFRKFEKFVQAEIGTYYETNLVNPNNVLEGGQVVVFEVTMEEVERLRNFELNLEEK